MNALKRSDKVASGEGYKSNSMVMFDTTDLDIYGLDLAVS